MLKRSDNFYEELARLDKERITKVEALRDQGMEVQEACKKTGIKYANYYAAKNREKDKPQSAGASPTQKLKLAMQIYAEVQRTGANGAELAKKAGLHPQSYYTACSLARKQGLLPPSEIQASRKPSRPRIPAVIHAAPTTIHITDEQNEPKDAPFICLIGKSSEINDALKSIAQIWRNR